MANFEESLDNAFNSNQNVLTQSLVNTENLTNFFNSLIKSADQTRVPLAFQKLNAMSPEQIAGIVSQVSLSTDPHALAALVAGKPDYAAIVDSVAKKVLSPMDHTKFFTPIQTIAQTLRSQPSQLVCAGGCGKKLSDEELKAFGGYCKECYDLPRMCPVCGEDFDKSELNSDDLCAVCAETHAKCDICGSLEDESEMYNDMCPSCIEETGEEGYDDLGDYFTQGDDGGGH